VFFAFIFIDEIENFKTLLPTILICYILYVKNENVLVKQHNLIYAPLILIEWVLSDAIIVLNAIKFEY